MGNHKTELSMVRGAAVSSPTDKKSRFPIILAAIAVLTATVINIISMSALSLDAYSIAEHNYYFFEIHAAKRIIFFSAYLLYSLIYWIFEYIDLGQVFLSQPLIQSPVFLLGSINPADFTVFITDIFVGGLQWYWIGRLIVWARKRWLSW
jgi:hypothetical protein